MRSTRALQLAALVPLLFFLGGYALMGWLDPSYWLEAPVTPPATLSQTTPKPKRPAPQTRPAPPWPDEPAMRLQLNGRGLRLTGFQAGPQRLGATEVRLTLQWQGRLGASLDMLQALALDSPQMAVESLVMQAMPQSEWRVIWRGQWQHLSVPHPLPPRPAAFDELGARAGSRLFDPLQLRRELALLWPKGQPAPGVLRMARPEELRLVAVLRQPEPLAWLSWQQHTLAVRLGDRMGPEGARVRAIEPDHVLLQQRGQSFKLTPTALADPVGGAPAPGDVR